MPHIPQMQHQMEGSTNTHVVGDSPMSAPGDGTHDRIRSKNRRKRYLDLHPEYFSKDHLEIADPLLYDRLVRRYQTAAERERQGRQRGYAGTLEADLLRSEAKLNAVQHPDPNSPVVYSRQTNGEIIGVEQDESAGRDMTKEESWKRWVDVMGQRFLRGEDGDFDYAEVDGNDDLDDRDEEARERLERYLHDEEEKFLGDGVAPSGQTGVQDF